MTWDGLVYLLQSYWPYVAGVGMIGLVTGWLNFSPPRS